MLLLVFALMFNDSLVEVDIDDVVGRMVSSSATVKGMTFFVLENKDFELFMFDHAQKTFKQIKDGRLRGIVLQFAPGDDGVSLIDPYRLTSCSLNNDGEFRAKNRWEWFDKDIYAIWVSGHNKGKVLCSYRSTNPDDRDIYLATLDLTNGQKVDVGYLPPPEKGNRLMNRIFTAEV